MGRTATNVLVFNDLVVKQAIKNAEGQPQREWRFERVLNPGKDHERRAPMPGFVFVTQPTGKGVFYKFYRNQLGALKKLRLGDYDEIGLEGARKLWEENTHSVLGGGDPAGEKHALRDAMTFKELSALRLDKGRLSATTRENYERHLNGTRPNSHKQRPSHAIRINEIIGDKPCEKVSKQDVIAICRQAEKNGNFELSNMLKSIIGGIYKYGRNEGLCDNNPCLGIGRRGPKVARSRNPSGDEIVALWKTIDDGYRGRSESAAKAKTSLTQAMKLIIKIGMVTGQRRTEVAGAKRTELSGLGTKDARWTIPGDVNRRGKIIEGRTKNGREQIVPLSPLAESLFKEALESCADREYLFPSDTTKTKQGKAARLPHIHGESVSKAVRRLRLVADVSDVTIHDMRRAISNYLKDEGVGREVRDLVLNHADGSVDGQHYSQDARMLTQVRSAFEVWAQHVEKLVTGQSTAATNVVPIRA